MDRAGLFRRTLRLRLSAIVTVICLLGVQLVATQQSGASPTPTPREPKKSASSPRIDVQLPPRMAGPEAMDELGRSTYADVYGGIAVDDDGAKANVYLTQLSATVASSLTAVAEGIPVTFLPTVQTVRQLEALEDRISDEAPELAKAGIHIVTSETDVRDGRIHVSILNLKDGDKAAVEHAVGSRLITVKNTASYQIPTSRRSEHGPRDGGGAMDDDRNR